MCQGKTRFAILVIKYLDTGAILFNLTAIEEFTLMYVSANYRL
jgi:hypothetical protein